MVAVLWFGSIARPGIWTDEDYSLRFAESYSTVDDDIHPPTYYALLRTWFLAAPATLVSARVLSASAFVVGVVLWGVLARRWWQEGRIPGVAIGTATALSLLSPHALLFGRMARYFGLVTLTTAVALLAWWAALARGGRGRAAVAVVANVAVGLLSYPAFAVLLAAETVTVVLRRRQDLARHVPVAVVSAALFAVAVLALPTNPDDFGGSDDVNRPAMAAVAVLLPLWSATVGETVSPLDPVGALPAAAAWVVLALATGAALRDRAASRSPHPHPHALKARWLPADPAVLLCLLLVVGTLGALVVVVLTVDLAHTGLQAPKYFAPISPALYLLVGLGVDRIWRSWRRPVLAVAVGALVAVGWGVGVRQLLAGEDYLYPSYALPWEDVAESVAAIAATQASDGRRVVVVASDRALLRLLADRQPAADLVDAYSADEPLVYDGAPPGPYDAAIFVQRQRLNAPAEEAVAVVREVVERRGLEPVGSETFGSVDPGLRRLQELFSGRDLDDHLVEVHVLVRD